MVLDFVS